MYQRILLTVDLNHPKSWAKALPAALELLQAGSGELHISTVVPTYGSSLVAGYFPDDFEAKALQTARAALDELIGSEVPAGVNVVPHVAHGAMHDEVMKQIEKVRPDLVVMASHQPDRIREFLVGSQADRVVRRSPVSVLVVRG